MNLPDHISSLRKKARRFPSGPGVYFMKDAQGKVIYVGKAKNLRWRVSSYFSGSDERAQIEFLLRKLREIEVIVTDSEQQAFILERDLIRKYRPRYNIRLKDDKAYLSIRIDENAPWPRLELVRKIEHDGAKYFGPYSFSYELRNIIDLVRRVVPLRNCSDTVFYNRQRPCLEYQIKRCAGPCCLPVERAQYMEWIRQAAAILEGRTDALLKDLKHQMERASSALCFEDAALLRDRVKTLEAARANRALASSGGEDRDIFNLHREGSLAALSVLRVHFGHVSDSVNFSLSDVQVPDEELLECAIGQFYEGGREVPQEIVAPVPFVNHSMLEEALREKRGGAVRIVTPRRGVRYRLLKLAELNAAQHYSACFDAEARAVQNAKEIAKAFRLKQVPRRIECVDISNLQGSDIVGALVSFEDGEPDRSSYKKYILSFQDKPDDFAAVHEVVLRRLRRGAEENDFPDLLIIDGGPGQLNKALEARRAVGSGPEIVALAKTRNESQSRTRAKRAAKPERIYIEGAEQPLELQKDSAVTHFLQRVRDEAHRYVISFHRRKRERRVLKSILDEIPGIGAERKRRLFKAYGSIARMRTLPADELSRTGRMPLALAHKLVSWLKINAAS